MTKQAKDLEPGDQVWWNYRACEVITKGVHTSGRTVWLTVKQKPIGRTEKPVEIRMTLLANTVVGLCADGEPLTYRDLL